MGISLKPGQIKRYTDLARVLAQHLGDGLRVDRSAWDPDALEPEDEQFGDIEKGRRLADQLEGMGPTFVKLGQLLSTRDDLVSPAYSEALTRLQERATPVPYEDIASLLEEELGVRISKAFSEFEEDPLAAASLGQVHRATLRDGRVVAVKVQRPEVVREVPRDMETIESVCGFLEEHIEDVRRHGLGLLLEEFRKTLAVELDYRKEAGNLERLARNLTDFDRILVPRPILDFSSRRVLTMEHVSGRSVGGLSPLVHLETDGRELMDVLFQAYLKQALRDGFVHADPHPGNIFLTSDRRLALLDLGMVLHLPERMRTSTLKLVAALSQGEGESAAEEVEALASESTSFDRDDFRNEMAELVARYHHRAVHEVPPGSAMLAVARTAGDHGLQLPAQFGLLGKTLLNLDRVAQILDPEFDPRAAVRRHASKLLEERMQQATSPRSVLEASLDAAEVAKELPGLLEGALETIGRNEFRLTVQVSDWQKMVKYLHRSAAHVTSGLIIAAMIVGASFLMRVETDFTLLGYPGLAMILFLFAAAGGVALIAVILRGEARQHEE